MWDLWNKILDLELKSANHLWQVDQLTGSGTSPVKITL